MLFLCIIISLRKERSKHLQTDIIIYFIKLFVMNVQVYLIFKKILNIQSNKLNNVVIILIFNLILSVFGTYIKFFINSFINLIIIGILYGSILGKVTKTQVGFSLIITLIAYAICQVCFTISTIICFLPHELIGTDNRYLDLIIIVVVQSVILYIMFKIKRLKNGLDFLQHKLNNDYTNILIINISTIIILLYCLTGSIYDEITKNLLFTLVLLGVSMFAIIQKTFVMYYKQKLLNDTIKQYEYELEEKEIEIEKLSSERYEISRINHEFYNRQRALELKVKEMTIEVGDEIGILDRIENLSKEYSQSLQEIKGKEKLPKTEISEIDDMFKYMQTECYKNNIEFKLHIEGEFYKLVNNIIPVNKLEILIGDHIRNAIIAINCSANKNRSILVILGIQEDSYELCIYDSGIEFEIETLQKLGKERTTTHKETGGSGIGFMTTFKTIRKCKASLIIEEKHEMKENDYTKALKIRFDGRDEYRIYSYRAEKIREKSKDDRIIIDRI